MSISSLLNIGSRAMNASYAQLTVTGNNIANANTDGYSRQSVELETAFSQQTGNGFFGKGVNIATVTRAHSDFLIREAALAGSLAAGDAARSSQLSQLENVFRLGEAGLGYAAQQMFNAFVDVANRPQDSSARQSVLARIGELASRFAIASGQLDALQRGVTDQLHSAVGSINSLTTQIADLNRQIASLKGTGHEPNDLLDQRDRAIGELSQFVQVTTLAADDGTRRRVSRRRPEAGARRQRDAAGRGGRRVRSGEAADRHQRRRRHPRLFRTASSPAARSPGCCASRTTTSPTRAACSASSPRRSPASSMRSRRSASTSARRAPRRAAARDRRALGRALVEQRDGRRRAGRLLHQRQRRAGLERQHQHRRQPGAAAERLRADGRPGAAGRPVPPDPPLRRHDPHGDERRRRRRLSHRHRGAAAGGARPLPAAAGLDRGARHCARLDDPKGIAAASPVAATTGVGNTGTAAIASLAAVSPSINTDLVATITFTDDLGNYSYSLVDTHRDAADGQRHRQLRRRPADLAQRLRPRLTGVPNAADSLVVARTPFRRATTATPMPCSACATAPSSASRISAAGWWRRG